MIGSHELLLIVRAQNQAGAAIGRVSRDIRNLQRQRDLAGRQASLTNRAAAQSLRLAQMESAEGTRRIALEQSRLRINHQIEAVTDRTAGLELRRAGIVSRANQLFRQEERIKAQILGLDDKDYAATTRILQAQQRMVRTQEAIASLRKGRVDISTGAFTQEPGIARAQAVLRAQRAQTTAMQAALQRDVAAQRAAMARSGGGDATIANQRAAIAERRFAEATEGARIAQQAVKELNVQEMDLRRTEEIQLRQVNELRAARSNLAREEAQLRAQLAGTQDAWAQLGARERQVQAAEAQHARQITELTGKLRALGAQELLLADEAKIAKDQLAITNAQLAEVNAQIARTNVEKFTTGARAVTHFGRVMQMTGLITTAALGAMAIAAGHFVQESTLAATQSGMTFTQIQRNSTQVQQAVLQQMQQFPAASQDVTKSFYDILSSMDVNTQGANRMMIAFQKTAVAGMAPLNDVVNAGITILNNFGRAAGTPDQAMNQLLATVRFGRLNVEQYTTSMNQLVPAFSNAGQSLLQMNSAFAELTRLMPSQRMAATSLARLMELFGRPNFAQGARQFGIIMRDSTGAMLPFNRIIRQFGTSMNPMIVKLREGRVNAQSFFKQISGTQGTVQAQRAFTELIRHSTELDKRMRQIHGDSFELTRSFNAMRRTPGVEWQVFVNTLKAAAIEIGFSVIPAFRRMGQFITPIIRGFNNLSPHTKRIIGDFAAFSAVVLLVGGTLTAFLGGLALFVVSIRTLGILGPITRLFTRNTAAVREGAVMLGRLETGLIDVRFGLIGASGALLVLTPLLIHFRAPILHALTGTHGLAAGFKLLSIAIGALTIRSMIPLLLRLVPTLATVTLSTRLFTLGLIDLGAASAGTVIAVGILGYGLSRLIRMIPGWDAAFKGLGGAIYNVTHAAQNLKFVDHNKAQADIAQINRMYDAFRLAGQKSKVAIENTIKQARIVMPDLKDHDIQVWADHAATSAGRRWAESFQKYLGTVGAGGRRFVPGITDFPSRRAEVQRAGSGVVGTGPISTSEFRDQMARLQSMRAALKPGDLAGWQRYWTQYNALMKRATNNQQQTLDQVGTRTDAQILGMTRAVQQLRAAWERNPSIANWNAYYRAQQALANQATDRQQQMVQEQGTLTDRQVLRMSRLVQRLRSAWERTPNIANWNAYYQAQQNLANQATQRQQQMAQDVQVLSDQDVLRMTRNVARLRSAWERSPSIENWKAYYQAQQALSEQASQSQQQMVQDIGTLTDAEVMRMSRNVARLRAAWEHAPSMANWNAYYQAQQDLSSQATQRQQAMLHAAPTDFEIPTISDRAAIQLDRQQANLLKAFNKAPSLQNWNAYFDAKNALTANATAKQIEMADAVIAAQEQNPVSTMSDQAVFRTMRRLETMKNQLEKHPSIAGWNAYYQALDNLNNASTSKQLQAVQSMLDGVDAAVQASKDKLDSIAQNVRSMYDTILQQNQAAFGSLLSGSFLGRGMDARIQAIRDAGTKSANALRAQATKITEAAQDAKDKISPAMGNLIDWGLAQDPGNDRRGAEKAAKLLNQRADAIEKAAGKRADALAKRISEHRLTPGELQKDLNSQLRTFSRWTSSLDALARRRGAPKTLVDEIRKLGPEYQDALSGILRMSPRQWAHYRATWLRSQKLIHQDAVKQLRAQLQGYRKQGQQIALAIAAGLRDENGALVNELGRIINRMFPGIYRSAHVRPPRAPAHHRAPAPHRGMHRVLMENRATGERQYRWVRDAQRRAPAPRRPSSRTLQSARPHDHKIVVKIQEPRSRKPTTSNTFNYNYHAAKDGHMSADTWFRRQSFRDRNRYKC